MKHKLALTEILNMLNTYNISNMKLKLNISFLRNMEKG